MSRYSTPLGSASASASASESDYAAPGRFPSNASTPNPHPLAAGYADQAYSGDDDQDHQQDADEEEEEEEAWDEVDIPQAAPPPPPVGSTADSLNAGTAEHGSTATGAGGAGIEIVIGRAPPKAKGNKA